MDFSILFSFSQSKNSHIHNPYFTIFSPPSPGQLQIILCVCGCVCVSVCVRARMHAHITSYRDVYDHIKTCNFCLGFLIKGRTM